MSESSSVEQEFLGQVVAVIEENLHDEYFGVTELAGKMSMSRSNLLLKVKKSGNISVNQLIKEARLKKGMELLRSTSLNVSEVSHKTGFNSASYFIKCFREHYGYPPGEAAKRGPDEIIPLPPSNNDRSKFFLVATVVAIALLIVASVVWLYPSNQKVVFEKSVLVLPFKNESNDSTNVYLINGLMESTLNNLQKIKDLRVLSRTSAEKYRNSALSIPEMAKELNVHYFIEGSGQKIGDQILLNIQLIDGATDKHLWANQYRREAKDIFELQQEIAKNIAEEIQAVITPQERERIEKKPTQDLVAYDYYLKGTHHWTAGTREALIQAIPFFEKAVARDGNFAIAYAALAVSYYYLDIFQVEKKYSTQVSEYSDKALLLDPNNGACLVTKAMHYMNENKPAEAVPYLEKALEYNPNSVEALNFLSAIYNFHLPNTSKHLRNALKAARLDVAALDSATASFTYMQLSGAFINAGFTKEAQKYIDKAYEYNKNNMYVSWIRGAILITVNGDYAAGKEMMIADYEKDTTRLHLLQEIAKIEYMLGNYESSYNYYDKFNKMRQLFNLDIFRNSDLTIGIVCHHVGKKEEGDKYIKRYLEFAQNDKTMYKNLHLAMYYAWIKDHKKFIEHLTLFSKEDNFQLWVLFLESDQLVNDLQDNDEFKKLMKTLAWKFRVTNKRIREELTEEGLL